MEEVKNKVYVGNLEYTVSNDDLRQVFETKGVQVKEAKIIQDKYTGRSKGFGFVELESEGEVQKAIEACDGQELKGRNLRVSKARAPRKRFDRPSREQRY